MRSLFILIFPVWCFAQFNPVDANTMLHLRSDLSVIVTGQGVSAWLDQTAKNHDAAQGTDGARPAYTASGAYPIDFTTDDFLEVATHSDIELVDSDLTIDCYFELDAQLQNYARLIDKRFDVGYMLGTGPNTGNKIYFSVNATNIPADFCISSIDYVAGTKYFVSAVYDGDSLYLYINGERDNAIVWTTDADSNNAQALWLGKSSSGNFLNGKIYEVRISNKARTAQEIADYYTWLVTNNRTNPPQSGGEEKKYSGYKCRIGY